MAQQWKHVIVIGASSGMGAELVRQLVARGAKVASVARRKEELEKVADSTATPSNVLPYPHDATCFTEVEPLFQQICRDLGGLDLIIYAAGVMPRIAENEYSIEKDELIVDVNLTGAIAWLNVAATRFGQVGGGAIAAISSVAGDRGRVGNPAYCAAKAGLNTYLEALRNRLSRHGVAVTTIKPGPVDTPMTEGLDKLPMLISAEQAASSILAAIDRRAHTAYIPGKWRLVMFILRSIPSFLFRKLKI